MFANKVDDKPATDEEKFTILLSYLKRGPYHLVKNIPINAEGYKTAKQLLKEHYGNKEETRDLITSRLMSTRKCHNGSEVRNMFHYVDGLTRPNMRGKLLTSKGKPPYGISKPLEKQCVPSLPEMRKLPALQ